MNKKKIKTIIGVVGYNFGNELNIFDFLTNLVEIEFGKMIPIYTTDPYEVLLQNGYDRRDLNYKHAKRIPSSKNRSVVTWKNMYNIHFITKRAIEKAFKHTDVLLMKIDKYNLDAYKDLLDIYEKDPYVNIITIFLRVNVLGIKTELSDRCVEYDQFEQMFHYFNGSYGKNSLSKVYKIEIDEIDGFTLKTCMMIVYITMSILLQNHQYLSSHICDVFGRSTTSTFLNISTSEYVNI